ncbi:hypothetical protein BUE93_20920 [Chromobacterium amazonense]|uniref:Uncharacterized protein n=1 Tax=Chromobacterium amazonense TaxID=1382803 RepID=A0A2S9WZ42_9NEIS|nr:hypothetical protein [Chromobacterium amazonense]PRP68729.1 hypothetical protein BUE93_20920 [Chromobacterium amazonense]
MEHTKGPWPPFAEACKPAFLHLESSPSVRLSEDDYIRARACVNACVGISTEQLEKNGENLTEIARALAAGCDAWERVVGRIIGAIPDSQVLSAVGTVGEAVSYFKNLHAQRDQLLAALSGLVDDIQGLMVESDGLAGFHRNGDIAPWDELEAGGRFERLSHLPDAISAIAAVKGESA